MDKLRMNRFMEAISGRFMTDEQMRIAIAQSVRLNPRKVLRGCGGHGAEGAYMDWDCPDYVNDLNAIREIEGHLEVKADYIAILGEITTGVSGLQWLCVFATARQRAEAYLRTIGRWKWD